jgi:hypothetical protein
LFQTLITSKQKIVEDFRRKHWICHEKNLSEALKKIKFLFNLKPTAGMRNKLIAIDWSIPKMFLVDPGLNYSIYISTKVLTQTDKLFISYGLSKFGSKYTYLASCFALGDTKNCIEQHVKESI